LDLSADEAVAVVARLQQRGGFVEVLPRRSELLLASFAHGPIHQRAGTGIESLAFGEGGAGFLQVAALGGGAAAFEQRLRGRGVGLRSNRAGGSKRKRSAQENRDQKRAHRSTCDDSRGH
jgi:hypothetical protein